MPEPPFVAFEPIGHRTPRAVVWLSFCLTCANLAAVATYHVMLLMVCPSYAAMFSFWFEAAAIAAMTLGLEALMSFAGQINLFEPTRRYLKRARRSMVPFPWGQSFSHKAVLIFGLLGQSLLLAGSCGLPFVPVRGRLREYRRDNVCAYMRLDNERGMGRTKPLERLPPRAR